MSRKSKNPSRTRGEPRRNGSARLVGKDASKHIVRIALFEAGELAALAGRSGSKETPRTHGLALMEIADGAFRLDDGSLSAR
jgi:hypothetical protein